MNVRLTLTLVLLAITTLPGRGTAQEVGLDNLTRDQKEIILKSERLRDLMLRLVDRYHKEGRDEQVKLLENGLRHLEKSGLLADVAGIRDRLERRAFNDALREQELVVEDLEQLLAILRDRSSVENLDKEIETTSELVATADQLLQRQTELQQLTRDSARSEPSAAEQQLLDALAELQQRQRLEAQRNARDAGVRVPYLEDALRRIEDLLARQARLEKRAASELDGSQPPGRQQAFQLGEAEEALRQLFGSRSTEQAMQRVARAAEQLKKALASGDAEATRQAVSDLQSQLEDAQTDDNSNRLQPWRERLEQAAGGREDRDELSAVAEEAAKFAVADAERRSASSGEELSRLAEQVEKLAESLAGKEGTRPGSSSEAAQRSVEALRQVAELSKSGRRSQALAKMSEAARQLAEARKRQKQENPDAEQSAANMAAAAGQVQRGLREAPPADDAGDEAQQRATEGLQSAEDALRDTAEEFQPDDTPPDRSMAERQLETARHGLETARDALQEALGQAGMEGRQAAMASAEERQERLRQETKELKQQLGGQPGISEQQQQVGTEAMQRAQDRMQAASKALRQGRQSTAARAQQQASDALQEAAEAMERNRPMSDEQRQAMAQLADQQEQLEDDIIRLAKLIEERKNRDAQRALEQAAQAAQRAQESMREGDQQATDEAQQQARDNLEEAEKALEEERDRYQDLRQEELLFRIKDELENFLQRQRPITEATAEAAGSDRVGRRLRRKLNDLGKQEDALGNKADYLRSALEEEGALVFSHVLRANQEDLADVAQRLSGRRPDPGDMTVMLQRDVEERTSKLIEALAREQQRRQDRQGGQDNKDNSGNQRPPLVPILAELQMLRRMEQDLLERTERMQKLMAASGGDGVSEVETALLDRIANRHNDISQIFLKLKAMLDASLGAADQGLEDGKEKEEGK